MRHRKSGRKFGMDSSARKAMLRNMVTSLILHGQIKTTEERAKELRRHAERLITIGKRAPHAVFNRGLGRATSSSGQGPSGSPRFADSSAW